MSIIHILNIADLAFIAAGLGAALLMILAGGHDDGSRNDEPDGAPEPRRPA